MHQWLYIYIYVPEHLGAALHPFYELTMQECSNTLYFAGACDYHMAQIEMAEYSIVPLLSGKIIEAAKSLSLHIEMQKGPPDIGDPELLMWLNYSTEFIRANEPIPTCDVGRSPNLINLKLPK